MCKMTDEHKFFCIECGCESIPLLRNCSLKRGKFHRKKLYCLNCRTEINHIECKTTEEIEEFQKLFAEGAFRDEAKESVDYLCAASFR